VGRTLGVLAGLAGGILLAGAAVGLLIPLLPPAWRSEQLVWAASATLVALCVGAAFLATRPLRK
jgi:hypothetical protein